MQYHILTAETLGIPPDKLNLLAVWREAPVFTDRERAALAWTELLTCIAQEHISDEDYAAAREHFSEKELVFLTAAIGAINSWNRLAVAFRFVPPART